MRFAVSKLEKPAAPALPRSVIIDQLQLRDVREKSAEVRAAAA